MSMRNERGFTIVEVLVAVMMLTVGVMALVGSSAAVTRMVGRGRHDTAAGQLAMARVERLRQIAASTATPCTSPLWRTDSATVGRIGERWVISAGVTPSAPTVRIIVSYPVARGIKVDTVTTSILCK